LVRMAEALSLNGCLGKAYIGDRRVFKSQVYILGHEAVDEHKGRLINSPRTRQYARREVHWERFLVHSQSVQVDT
jgi:hypothetical protein